ncbi:ATP-dependent RNA helicase [Striga asiatica]|uniref:ATP-dependent RNA helicase n=1 Tax=Striga asiatica TaxID=4170 RepID=A0A5A7PY30_STRAF|nr:ATP-dependent RNA helicase [Striga asiatica]
MKGLDIIGVQTVKKAGSRLRSRIVAEQSIRRWSQMIEQMEDEVSSILLEEREEMALRRAKMEAKVLSCSLAKIVVHLIAHKDEICSRSKRTWFVTEKEKKLVGSGNEAISVEQAEELKMKERETRANIWLGKAKEIGAARNMLEDEEYKSENRKARRRKQEFPLLTWLIAGRRPPEGLMRSAKPEEIRQETKPRRMPLSGFNEISNSSKNWQLANEEINPNPLRELPQM